MFYVILCFFTTNTRKKIVNHCVFLYFLTPWCRCARRQYWGLVLLVFFGVYFGFCCKRVVRPKQHREPSLYFACFCVFLQLQKDKCTGKPPLYFACFCVFLQHKKNRWTGHVFCVFLYFFFRSVDTKPTCSMCFCVFLFINFYFSHNSDRGKHLMFFVCFCVFAQRSQVTPPMYFVCFCVFFFQRLVWS